MVATENTTCVKSVSEIGCEGELGKGGWKGNWRVDQ